MGIVSVGEVQSRLIKSGVFKFLCDGCVMSRS